MLSFKVCLNSRFWLTSIPLLLLALMLDTNVGASPPTSIAELLASPIPSSVPSPSFSSVPVLPSATSVHFPVGEGLRKNFEFWVQIYSQYGTNQGLIHDAKCMNCIYEVLDFHESKRSSTRMIRDAKLKWRTVLLSLHRKTKGKKALQDPASELTLNEFKIYKMFEQSDEPNKFLNAAHRKRLRFQLGQKDHFLAGLQQSGRYLPLMEEVFRKEGLPIELTRLPFVESSFNLKARSKVGASGIWQFMRSTGKFYVKINDALDERNDPIRATEAAARLLKQNYESLGSWPLAVTAYNHGRNGMMRAVRRIGSTDLDAVVNEYRSRSFGFASSNFYTEFLAAVEVERNAEKYFGVVLREVPLRAYEVEIPDSIYMRELAKFLSLNIDELKRFNPALSPSVITGARRIPAGYRLRLPQDEKTEADSSARVFLAGYQQIPAMFKLPYGRGSKSQTKKPRGK